jgi:hypothetical protein
MHIAFQDQPDHARVWIYQANRDLELDEAQKINQILVHQLDSWAAHGAPLSGSVLILHNRFVVVAVDPTQNMPSGCSIDASTHWLKQIGEHFKIDFFDRSIGYLDTNNQLQTIEATKAKTAILDETIKPNTLIFNNLVQDIETFKSQWQVQAQDSWMKRFFCERSLKWLERVNFNPPR